METEPMPRRSYSSPSDVTPGVLYVLIHGLVCLVDVGNLGFLGYVIDVGDCHKYLAGEWLIEKELLAAQGGYENRLQLVGVTPGDARLDTDSHAIVRMTKAPVGNEVPLRAIITLPRPREIGYGVKGRLDDEALHGNLSKLAAKPTIVSGLTIFIYDFVDASKVSMVHEDGDTFVACPRPDDKNHVSVLHIYNEPIEVLPSDHNIKEFNDSFKLLNATDVEMVNPSVSTEPSELDLNGLLFGETEPLDSRATLGSILVRNLRSGKIPDSSDVGSGSAAPVCGGAHGTVV